MALVEVEVLKDRCAGCEECLVRCPVQAISMDELTWTVVVDEETCIGCHQCERTCPFSAIVVHGDPLVAPRVEVAEATPEVLLGSLSEIRVGFSDEDELVAEASRCLKCPDPTCVRGCPTHNNIPLFIDAARRLELAEAREILATTSSLPEICSRVCDFAIQCEGSCSYALAGGQPVAIHEIERFIADHAELVDQPVEKSGFKVACIGSGPASLGAADVLSRTGAEVVIYEKSSAAGGLLRNGIPDFTLPDAVVDKVLNRLVGRGVKIVTDTEVSTDRMVTDLAGTFDAVIVGVGAQSPIPAPAKGRESVEVLEANDFLSKADHLIKDRQVDASQARKILVLGAGNTAMDVARMNRRLGGESTCVDWMARKYSLVRPDEMADALREGVEVLFGVTVSELENLPNGKIQATLVETEQHDALARPKVTDRVFAVMEVDAVVEALGFRIANEVVQTIGNVPIRKELPEHPENHWVSSGIFNGFPNEFSRGMKVGEIALGRDRARRLAAIPHKVTNLYVVGDALVGPSTVVEAMAHGRRVASAILERRARQALVPRARRLPPRVLFVFDSEGGHTRAACEELARRLALFTDVVETIPVDQVEPEIFADFEVVILAGWVDGMVVAGQHASRRIRELAGKLPKYLAADFAVLLTYKFGPGSATEQLATQVRAAGHDVVAEFATSHKLKGLNYFVERLGEKTWPDITAEEIIDFALKGDLSVWQLIGPRRKLLSEAMLIANERRGLTGAYSGVERVMRELQEMAAGLDVSFDERPEMIS
jgi:glutamate synthase (NADPH/NADH) small chain